VVILLLIYFGKQKTTSVRVALQWLGWLLVVRQLVQALEPGLCTRWPRDPRSSKNGTHRNPSSSSKVLSFKKRGEPKFCDFKTNEELKSERGEYKKKRESGGRWTTVNQIMLKSQDSSNLSGSVRFGSVNR